MSSFTDNKLSVITNNDDNQITEKDNLSDNLSNSDIELDYDKKTPHIKNKIK